MTQATPSATFELGFRARDEETENDIHVDISIPCGEGDRTVSLTVADFSDEALCPQRSILSLSLSPADFRRLCHIIRQAGDLLYAE